MLALIGYTPDDVYMPDRSAVPLRPRRVHGRRAGARSDGRAAAQVRSGGLAAARRDVQASAPRSAAPTPIRMVCNLPAEVKAKYDTSSMKRMIANAAPWSFALKQMYLADFPADSLFEVYGSTELGVNCILQPEDQLRKPGSCGQAGAGGRDQAVRRRRQRGHRHRARAHRRAVREDAERVRRLLQAARQVPRRQQARLPDRRRHRLPRRRGLRLHLRPQEGHDHLAAA